MARCFIFSKPVKGENFLRYPLSSKPNDFMPLIARKNQGSTPIKGAPRCPFSSKKSSKV